MATPEAFALAVQAVDRFSAADQGLMLQALRALAEGQELHGSDAPATPRRCWNVGHKREGPRTRSGYCS